MQPLPAKQCAAVLSSRTQRLHSSPIRDILSVIDQPGMVSFAGGLPAPETFPAIDLTHMPTSWLQYGASEGEPVLRERIARELQELGLPCGADQVLVLSGSQQGIDLVAKLFIDEGTAVALESPTYLAALQVFRFYGLNAVTLDPQDPARALATGGARPALCYVIPTFQNPTGRCWSPSERDALAAVADNTGVTVFEDDPYRDLVYDSADRTPVCARLRHTSWIYQGSFSKSFAPGIRLGFLAASPALMPLLTRAKQAADLHSSRVSQWLALEQLNDPQRPQRLARLVQTYRQKRDHFEHLLQRHMRTTASWDLPPGGLFFWLRLRKPVDTTQLLAQAISNQVAFMPGEPFFANAADQYPSIRLNFSHASAEAADRGLATLARLLG